MTKRSYLALLLGATLLLGLAACGGKGKVKNENEYKPGRDKELYGDAEKRLKKGRYDEARLLYNVVITTYPDSEYLALAKLAIADSFYLEGGSSNLEQAIGGYKDFAQYFPTHPLTCNVKLKIAHSHMRQMNAFNRDWTPARKAEFQLKATEMSCRNSPLYPQISQNLQEVQQILALHEMDIARFYMANRQAYKAAEGRLRDVVANYPLFSYRDEALYKLGVALIEQEQPEEAAQFFAQLVRDIPASEFVKDAKLYLEKLNKPIPEPSAAGLQAGAPPRPGRIGQMKLILGMNDLEISKDGVLVSKEGDTKAESADQLQKPVQVEGGVQAVRSNSKAPVTATPVGASGPAPAESAAKEGATEGATITGGGKDAVKPKSAPKSDDKKEDPKKKKKNFLGGIFK